MATVEITSLQEQLRTAHAHLLNVGPMAKVLMEAAAGELDRKDAEIARLTAERDRMSKLLLEARQYVSDAGNDEDAETQRNSTALLNDIDAARGHEQSARDSEK